MLADKGVDRSADENEGFLAGEKRQHKRPKKLARKVA
jgi:hypothetical protein